ncbi:chalcone isomerase family protein [Pelomonas sp. KK5]|uniref:chalcone isomerase family protein n=1 Tax=Pelomonas sp. KK5 TaxID=1855730 RepID=UPI00097BBD9B|nr:chalcone isomerase family protein [Pelomonas sp. KK5]
MFKSLLALAVALGVQFGAQAEVVEVAGVKYETVNDVGGQKLQLNGAGIRYKAVFKVYTAGLYTATKATTADAVINGAGAKRIHIVALRDINGNDLGKLFTKGIEENSTREEFAKSINGVLKISELFAAKKELRKGEEFSVDWVPNTGAIVTVNGVQQGAPIKEYEFYAALLRIWLGKAPADFMLKDALLGQKAR